jgi:hypothetical protein
MQPAQAQVTLEIEINSEPISGSLSDRDGASRAFSGWIQLVSLLQDAATTRTSEADQPIALAVTRPEEAI